LLSGLLVDLLDSICTSLALTRLVSLIQDWVIHVLFFCSTTNLFLWMLVLLKYIFEYYTNQMLSRSVGICSW
jgi:hypothetical protein